MTINGYLSVRRWQRRGTKPRGQRSPFTTRDDKGELASRTHGKSQGKGMINLVNGRWRKTGDTPQPKWCVVCRWCSSITIVSSIRRPGDSASLKVWKNVGGRELGKPVASRNEDSGIRTVRNGEGAAGKGCQRKQKPWCNVTDRRELSRDIILRPKGSRLLAGLDERESLNSINLK